MRCCFGRAQRVGLPLTRSGFDRWRPIVGPSISPKKGRLAVKSIETPVTLHCNLRCAACDHASPFAVKSFLDVSVLARDLKALGRVVKADEFRLVGGEPLQHPDLLSVIEVIRKSRIAESIVLVTNGMLLNRVDAKLWSAIDRLWLSIYPGVSLPLSLKEIAELCSRYDVRFAPDPKDEFRTVLLNNRIDDIDLVKSIYRNCKTAHVWKCYTVLDGYFYKCSKSSVMRDRLVNLGLASDNSPVDGVNLRYRWRLRSRLRSYLKSKEPLVSCRACLGTSGPLIRHQQLNSKALRAAAQEDHSALIEQVKKELGVPQKSRAHQ